MDGYTRRVFAANFTLASMKAASDFQAQRSNAVQYLFCARNSAARSIKGCQHTISGFLNQSASETINTVLANAVVIIEQRRPILIANVDGSLSGLDDISEHDSGEDT